MRRITLAGTFLILLGGLYLLWQRRFERSREFRTFRLEDMRNLAAAGPGAIWSGADAETRLRVNVDPAHPNQVVQMQLPGMKAADFLHLRFRVMAHNLTPGTEFWEGGRCMVEWHAPSAAGRWENDPFCLVILNADEGMQEVVMRPEDVPAIPAIRIENLGVSGALEISTLEATVVRERTVWKIGKWLLLAGWLAWAVACIRTAGETRWVRPLAAGAVWLVMCLYCVVPGPWKALHSFPRTFQIGPEVIVPMPTGASAVSRATTGQPELASVGKIPDKGDFTLKVKIHAAKARPLLHVALLFGPALLMALLAGNRGAAFLSVILAISIEVAQFSFGFGFDLVDVMDLACDAVGIALALTVANRLRARFARPVPAKASAEGLLPSAAGD